MGEDQSGRTERTSQMVTNSTHFFGLTLGGRLNRDFEIVNSHTTQIASLRKEIEEKNEAISRLNKDVKDLREEKDDLKITVESKDQEIKALKDKINKLETEKKALETKLRSVEVELDAVKKEVVEMKEANKTSEERNATLEIKVERLTKKMEGVTKNLEESRSENTTLKKDVKILQEEMQSMASVRVADRMSLPFLSDPVEKASLVLGELCWRVQAMMYQKVFPNSYDCRKSYKIKHIEEDIEELDDERQKDEAKKRWVALKKKLNWKKIQHTRAMKSIQESRNITAHPELDEQLLEISAELMEQEGKLTDWHSPACVRELIEMWKQLTQQH